MNKILPITILRTLQYHAFLQHCESQIIAERTGFSVDWSEYAKKKKVKLITKKNAIPEK